jgi:membrane associated rhomboid family serine protease
MKSELKSLLMSFWPGIVLTGIMVGIHYVATTEGISLLKYGVFPRSTEDLSGILTYPFIHKDWDHLFSNAVPLVVLTALLHHFYNEMWIKTLIFGFLLSGTWLWIGGRPSYHIGASGIVYTLAAFVFFSGVWRKERRTMAVSMVVVFLYGGMVWGLYPFLKETSWEGHLFGGLAGFFLSWIYRKQGPQKVLYEWEQEGYVEEEENVICETPLHMDFTNDPAELPPVLPESPPDILSPRTPVIRYEYEEIKEKEDKQD